MSYETLTLEQNEAVLTITVNRPEALNAQSRMMLEDFDRATAEAARDDSVKVIIVAGAGKHFSAGHDIGSPQELADQQRRPMKKGTASEYQRTWDLYFENTLRWRDLPKPTIASSISLSSISIAVLPHTSALSARSMSCCFRLTVWPRYAFPQGSHVLGHRCPVVEHA